jgi:hypothetical protein
VSAQCAVRSARCAVLGARCSVLIALLLMGMPLSAAAQPYIGTESPRRGSLEVSGGMAWTGGYDAGSAQATLTRSTPGTPALTFFLVEGQMQSAPGAIVHVGVYVARRVAIEAGFEYSRPVLRARVTGDFESAPDVDADGVITSYLAGGSLLYHFGSGRFVPFVSGGGGYLRQIDETNADVLTGTEMHAGGGLKVWLGTGRRRVGLRLEAAGSARSKTVAFEQKRRIVPNVAAGISYLF